MNTSTSLDQSGARVKPSPERVQVEAMLSEGGGVTTFTADPPLSVPLSSAPPSEMSAADGAGGWLRYQTDRVLRKFGYYCLRSLAHREGRVSESFRTLPDDAHRRAEQTRLALSLIDDFKDGTYRNVPWATVALLAGALLYVTNPRDLVPEFIPLLGDLDDIALLTLAIRVSHKELRRYCRFKGYREADYFGAAYS
jgi:uncharacterized membrane protein YkvA (DUF1232 family)